MLAAWGSAFGPMPAMTIESAGYGAGARDLDEAPNCTQVVVGQRADSPLHPLSASSSSSSRPDSPTSPVTRSTGCAPSAG